MICKKCGMIHDKELKYCSVCGSPMEVPVRKKEVAVPARQEAVEVIPEKYRPLGAWAYFGYQLLFAIPLVGFILLIVFSCDSSNLNRRNFARSYWCSLLVSVIIILLLVVIVLATGFSIESLRYFS